MRRRELKEVVPSMLKKEPWPTILTRLSQYEEKEIINHLFTALCHSQKIRWHAISAFGNVVPRLAAKDPESARIVMRRFLWNLNDESGGIGWGIPEAMAEVMVHDDMLFSEYSHMLISYMRQDGPEVFQDGNFIELPALQQGVLWGVARLLDTRQREMIAKGIAADLYYYLDAPDNAVRGLAAMCLGMCRNREIIEVLQSQLNNSASFTLYWDYTLREVKVAAIAKQAIDRLHLQA